MPETYPTQSTFVVGEITPRLYGRIDLKKYVEAVSQAYNFKIIPHGGMTRRPGTRYVATANNGTAAVALIPFQFNDVQAYVIELGNLYARFYTLNGQLVDGSSNPVQVTTPYTSADVAQVRYAQSADVMYLFHGFYPVQKLQRTSATTFTLSQIDFLDGPYLPQQVSSQFPAASGVAKISTNGLTGTLTMGASQPLWVPGHVGSYWRIKNVSVWGWVKITGYTSSTAVTAVVQTMSPVNGAAGTLDGTGSEQTAAWREGMIGQAAGYPTCGVFHQQRLWAGGMSDGPTSLIASQTANFETFSDSKSDGTVLDTSGIVYNIASDKMNVIRWILPGRNLMIGTAGSEHELVGGSSSTPAITPTNALVRSQTSYGCNKVQPFRVANVIIFPQRSGRELRELAYDFNSDSYNAPDLALLAEHLLPMSRSIVDMAYQQEKDPTLWLVRDDGLMLMVAYDRSQDVVGWAQCVTGATGDGFESVAVIPHPDGDRDQVWVAVRRTINGTTYRFIEYLDDKGNPYDTYLALTTDAAVTYSGAAATTLSGLTYLNGATVDLVGNGAVFPPQVVSGGQVTFSSAVTTAEVGLHFDSELITVAPEVRLQSGTSQGLRKKWAMVAVRLYNTLGLQIGVLRNANDPIQYIDTIPFRTGGPTGMVPGVVPPLFTGWIVKSNLGIDQDAKLVFKQTQPLPCTILFLTGTLEVADVR